MRVLPFRALYEHVVKRRKRKTQIVTLNQCPMNRCPKNRALSIFNENAKNARVSSFCHLKGVCGMQDLRILKLWKRR